LLFAQKNLYSSGVSLIKKTNKNGVLWLFDNNITEQHVSKKLLCGEASTNFLKK
jgi:hypothetical protein